MAAFQASTTAVFFPNWAARESAIGRSPLCLDGVPFSFSNWVEVGEKERGFLRHKVWIRLINWPVLCWSEAEVEAAVSGFGELWEVDERSSGLAEVSYYRALVRCQDESFIPDAITLMVEDRSFHIPIEVESTELAEPILLGEEMDQRLGLSSREAHEEFITSTGFSSIPVANPINIA